MDQRDSHCPWARPRETTDSGTGEWPPAGQEDPVELDSSPRLCDGGRLTWELPRHWETMSRAVIALTPWSAASRGGRTPAGGEFGWGGAPAKAQRRRPKVGSGGTETRRGA